MAVSDFPALVQRDARNLKKIAANRDRCMADLDAVPGEAEAWLEDHSEKEVEKIAAFRQQATDLHRRGRSSRQPPLDKDGLWHPMSKFTQAVIGEKNARGMLFRAEELRGRAKSDPEIAAYLAELGTATDPALLPTLSKLDAAVWTAAARQRTSSPTSDPGGG